MDRLLTIGLDEPEVQVLRERLSVPITAFEMLPRLQLWRGQLRVGSPWFDGSSVPISQVVFHGIFEEDLPLLSALALWGGPCFPGARGMMDCRLRLPCLVRALEATRFGSLARGFVSRGVVFPAQGVCVAKWGEWHCGENKERFTGEWSAAEPALIESFVEGEAVRVQLIGEQAWQFRLGGEDWKKSIHGAGAASMPLDPELVEDAQRLKRHFGLEIVGIDYMIAADGGKHLLEVNHIPSVTAFAEVRDAYLEYVLHWVTDASRMAVLSGPLRSG